MKHAPAPSADSVMEQLARHLAPLVAPLVAAQLAGGQPGPARGEYGEVACEHFVRELGQGVLNKAQTFFGILRDQGRVDSLELAQALSLGGPREISGAMTTSLKQRANTLGLELPWAGTNENNRTVWVDRDDIAARMYEAIYAEQVRRGNTVVGA